MSKQHLDHLFPLCASTEFCATALPLAARGQDAALCGKHAPVLHNSVGPQRNAEAIDCFLHWGTNVQPVSPQNVNGYELCKELLIP